jgi:hypothetical protein
VITVVPSNFTVNGKPYPAGGLQVNKDDVTCAAELKLSNSSEALNRILYISLSFKKAINQTSVMFRIFDK